MGMETLEIGAAPYDEACAQVGVHEDAGGANAAECRAYVEALRRVHGPEPEGSALTVRSNAHDFGTYREAAYRHDPEVPAHRAYARKAEAGLATWAQAGMAAPVAYDARGRPLPRIAA